MNTRIENVILATVMAGALTIAVVGCGKAADSAGMALPTTTVGNDIDDSVILKGAATSVGKKVDAGIITSKVKAALLADVNVKSMDIAVVTRDNEVLLTGFVDSQAQMDRAIAIARAVEGVRQVSNEMSVKK